MCAAVLLGVVAGKVLSLAEREVIAAALLPAAPPAAAALAAVPPALAAALAPAAAAPLAAPAAAPLAAAPLAAAPLAAAPPAAAPLAAAPLATLAAPRRRTISTLNHFYLVPILKNKSYKVETWSPNGPRQSLAQVCATSFMRFL